MEPDPPIDGYIKKLSEKIRSAESDCIMDLLPNGNEKEKSLLSFLFHSPELFSNSFCFRPSMARLVMTFTKGDYLAIVRKIKKSDMAIFVWLLRTGTTFKITVCEFNIIKSVGDISNYRDLTLESCRLINCHVIFEAQCEKKEYGWLASMINKFSQKITGNRREQKIKERIWEELEKLEKNAQWFIENKVVTINR